MASSIRLTDEEAWKVLAHGHTGILTSLRHDGMPIALPVWFVAMDTRVYVAGQAHTKKYKRIAHDPRVSFLVESGDRWIDFVGVHLTGRAAALQAGSRLDEVMAAMHEKYAAYRSDHSQMPADTRAYYETQSVTVEIIPDARILTWQNARMFRDEDT